MTDAVSAGHAGSARRQGQDLHGHQRHVIADHSVGLCGFDQVGQKLLGSLGPGPVQHPADPGPVEEAPVLGASFSQ